MVCQCLRVQAKTREFVCVCICSCGYTYEDHMSSQGQKDEKKFQSSKDHVRILYLNNKIDHPDPIKTMIHEHFPIHPLLG